MKNKPIVFTIISILCLIEPAIKILYFKAITHFDFMVILSNLQTRNTFMEVVDFWLIFPIAGFLILKLRKWTYFAFMSVLAYIIYNISTYEKYTWPYNSDTPFLYNYVIAGLSLSVFVYFLFPNMRHLFFDRRARMWETKTRYSVGISCKLMGDSLTFPSRILNISKTGAFFEESPYLKVGDLLLLEFNFIGHEIKVPVRIIHQHKSSTKAGFGAEFVFESMGQSLKMSKVINVIKKSHNEFKENKMKLVA